MGPPLDQRPVQRLVIFMHARVSLALLSLRENEGLIVVKIKRLDQQRFSRRAFAGFKIK